MAVAVAGGLLGARDASRMLAFGGLALMIATLLLGEIYAIFVSHVANADIRAHWVELVEAVAAGRDPGLESRFEAIFALSEQRGRFMSTHSHAGAYALLALALAVLAPLMAAGLALKRRTAVVFLAGAVVHCTGLFVAYYTGAGALLVANAGALAVIAAVAMLAYLLHRDGLVEGAAPAMRGQLACPPAGLLLRAGLVLMALGMLGGLLYAGVLVTGDEPSMYASVAAALEAAGRGEAGAATDRILAFKRLQSKIAITAAAHSHAVEFGFLLVLVAPLQSLVLLAPAWRRRWAWVMLTGAFGLPACVYLATRFGLRAAAFADLSGALVLLALSAMAVGIIRHTGAADQRGAP